MESIMKNYRIFSPRFYREKMGKKTISFDKLGNIIIDRMRYEGTPELYQLIFYKRKQLDISKFEKKMVLLALMESKL